MFSENTIILEAVVSICPQKEHYGDLKYKTDLNKSWAHLFWQEVKWTKSDNLWLTAIDKIYHHISVGLISAK